MPFLFWRDSQGENHESEVGDQLVIGRSPDAHSHFDDHALYVADPHVSRQHARIERTFRGYELSDLQSSNGTRVNAGRLSGYHVLMDGDVIGVGGTIFTFRQHRLRGVTLVSDLGTAELSSRAQRVEQREYPPSDALASVDELRKSYDRLRLAYQLHRAVGVGVEPSLVMRRICEAALELFQPDRVLILLYNERNGEYEPELVLHRDATCSDVDVVVSRTILREVVHARAALMSNDAIVDRRFRDASSVQMQGIRTTMTAPLLREGQVHGVIHLDSKRSKLEFDLDDLSLLQDFADHASRALELAWLADARSQQVMTVQRLKRLLPEEIVADVMQGKRAMERGGVVRDASVLFCDVRGFTALSEELDADAVVEILNEYFELMVEQVFALDGSLDKFIGDEMMAVWGAHLPIEDHAYKAVRAAMQMQDAMARLNDLRETRGLRAIQVGIGVNSGELLAGYMGSSQAMNYTVIGDTVNVAARLCSIAAAGEVIISGDVVRALDGRMPLERLPPQALKGKSEAVELYRVLRD